LDILRPEIAKTTSRERFLSDVSARQPFPRITLIELWVMGHLLLGSSLNGSLGDFAGFVLLDDTLDDTDSNSLSHVTNSETSKWWVVGESLDAHWLGGNHLDDGGVTRLDKFRGRFGGFTGTAIDLLQELGELAGNVGSVTIQDWSVTSTDLTWVVKDNDLGVEGLGTLWRVVLGVTSDVTTANFLDGDVLDVESDIVTWKTLNELLVVHLDRLDFSGDTSWGEGDDHTGLDDTSLDTTDWYCSNTTNLVDILEGKTEGLVGWTGWWVNGINGLEKGLSGDLGLGLLLPALVPWAVGRVVDHVVAVETGDWHEGNVLWVVADLLDEGRSLLDDFVESLLGPLGGVHLVDGNDELLDT